MPKQKTNRTPKPKYTLVIYKAKDGFRCRILTRNGRIIGDSGEAYKRKSALVKVWTNFINSGEVLVIVDETKK